jgi:hypothetical protein
MTDHKKNAEIADLAAANDDPMQPDATKCNISGAQPECNITERHRAAIELLCTGAADGAVAESLQIHRATLYRWKCNPHFAAALQSRRHELTRQSADRFRSVLNSALDTFQKQISDPYVPTAYRAARGLLALAHINKLLLEPPPFDPPPDDPTSRYLAPGEHTGGDPSAKNTTGDTGGDPASPKDHDHYNASHLNQTVPTRTDE